MKVEIKINVVCNKGLLPVEIAINKTQKSDANQYSCGIRLKNIFPAKIPTTKQSAIRRQGCS